MKHKTKLKIRARVVQARSFPQFEGNGSGWVKFVEVYCDEHYCGQFIRLHREPRSWLLVDHLGDFMEIRALRHGAPYNCAARLIHNRYRKFTLKSLMPISHRLAAWTMTGMERPFDETVEV